MRLTNYLAVFRRISGLVLAFLVALSMSRLLLVAVYWDRVAATDGLGFILLQGIRYDIILIGMLFGPVFFLKTWFHTLPFLRRFGQWFFPVCVGLMVSLAFFVEASTTSFIAEYDSRPNYLFVEYLVYPKEVLSMLAGSHLLELVGFTAITLFLAGFAFTWLRRDPSSDTRLPFWFCLLATPLIAILVLAMVRSTLDHRPVNPSNAVFSQDSMVNQLPLNSPYSLLYAIYEHRRDSSSKVIRYGAMDNKEALDIVLKEAGISPGDLLDPAVPTLHHQKATQPRDKPLNLVIILEESLGADTVGSLGGWDITPELDKLASQGIWFERLYSTGTRSVRGIEAVISGFTPTPMVSVVKLAETQSNFFTIASLLNKQGYQTSFIYGGEAHFDNMKRFMLNNGFQTVIDEKDYPQPVFQSTWGVSDEDLFNRAHEELSKSGQQPFFSLVFTSSNHEPFEIPQNRVSPEDEPEGARKTAIKYADYALGRFLEKARQSNYWENTVFLVIADHPARLFAGGLVPVQRFLIPGVIIGPTIEPRRITGITSQIDIVPTLLSLMGIDSDHPGIGRDLTQPAYANGSGRAMMQFNALQAYLEDDRIVVLQPDLEPSSFRLEPGGEITLDTEPDPELERKALAYSLWGPMMIRLKAYHE
jgi:phosphoglycerol transferase MdoB-like AlkP superfamily enzyme